MTQRRARWRKKPHVCVVFVATVATYRLMSETRRLPKQYHDYDKDPFCITEYRDEKRPDLKWMVRSKLSGKWERRFFQTKGEATTHVGIKRIELINQGKEGVMFPSGLRVMAQLCAEKLHAFGKSIDDATDFYLKHLFTEKKSVPIEQAVEELITHARDFRNFSTLYVRDLKYRLGRFAQAFAGRSVASIERSEIKDWLESLEVGPGTHNTFRRDVRTLFTFCSEEKRYRADNPAKGKGLSAKNPTGEIDILTVEEAGRLIASASPDMLAYWAIGLFAGLRPSEIRALQWSAIDFKQKHIVVHSAKTGRKRFVRIQPNLLRLLWPCRRRTGKVVSPLNFRKQSRADKAAAKLGERWTQDIMRHSFASYWMANFKNLHALAEEMGNSPKVVVDHYKDGVPERSAKAFWKIEPPKLFSPLIRFS
jgi:integrase